MMSKAGDPQVKNSLKEYGKIARSLGGNILREHQECIKVSLTAKKIVNRYDIKQWGNRHYKRLKGGNVA